MTQPQQPIKIAILAMGGEGGGVLADWLVDLGEANGWIAQTTSVPGVAQRTGATIYYVEMYPEAQAHADGGQPVLALMPLPGDVDVVLCSELMEAGRAVQRGLVSPDRTTLVASTHRVYSIAEKSAMGDGRVDSAQLLAHAEQAAQRFVRFDMAEAAAQNGSVISAVLFGALAGTGVLPFAREQFEATIERGGVGVKPSLKAFGAAFARAQAGEATVQAEPVAPATPRATSADPDIQALLTRLYGEFPVQAQPLMLEGLRRLVDYQDVAYAALYLDRMAEVCQLPDDAARTLACETARHLALWMSYEDTARVAQLKTRSSRFARVKQETGVNADQVIAINEYMHPGLREICETLPGGIGRWLMGSGAPRRLVESMTKKGRVVQTSSVHGFLLLSAVAFARRWRRSTIRYTDENGRIEQWLLGIRDAAMASPELAVELARCQKLVKGYSDTHERGVRNYDTVIAAWRQAGTTLAPATLRAWREAALADEHGHALKAALAQHAATTSTATGQAMPPAAAMALPA
ncbi:indolepyruvate ferredoxin oxidoreductase beta subunit [Pseudacidovorax intermedius]|uniref:Indolepyruvate ferredoxin oxidoreductase beta subunit n=1 Tax=Pseudacidovorax intermedius TaxID=433924 RepID=A0A370FG96_9BURK|nr:indolepyruvate oxidoreductase subunit beta family protein [Pseudacidovorax intermedius]RDI25240.1 indolepyruvate ferredoxin oxidoreductase beta subunit [Pseudacidovorax intermedius]